MPRAGDLFPARRGGNDVNSPLRGLLDFTSPLDMTAQAAGGAIRGKIEDVVSWIKDTTGIDLSGFTDLLNGLETATGLNLFELADLNLTDNIPQLLDALQGIDWQQPGAIKDAIEAAANAVPVIGPLLAALIGQAIPDDANPLAFVQTWGDNLRSILPGIDLNLDPSAFNPAAALANLVNLGIRPLGLLLGFGDPLNAGDLFGSIRSNLLGLVPHTSIGNVSPNLVPDPTFQDAASLDAIDGVDWDGNVGRTVAGSARITCDGTKHEILTDPATPVSAGQTIPFEAWARWQNLVGGTLPIQLGVATYNAAGVYLGTTNLGAIGAAGTQLTFQRLVGTTYTVPAGVAYIRQSLAVMPTATSGFVWLDDADHHKTQPIGLSLVDQLPQRLQLLGNGIQDMIEAGWKASFGAIEDGIEHTIDDLLSAWQNIPPTNVGGVGGLGTVADTFETMWNRVWGGLKQTGGGASGKSIADTANAAQDVAANADTAVQIGEWNNAILGIRNDNDFTSGMDPTAVSMFPMPAPSASGGDPPYLNATAAVVPISFWMATNDAKRGSVQWLGRGNANITALYIDVYRWNTATNVMELLHTSQDMYPQLSAAWKPINYQMPTNLRIDTAHGDTLAIGWRVTGSGTHQVACRYAVGAPDTTQSPQRPSAQRTGTLVGNLPFGSVQYVGDVGWVALGIVEGDVAPPYYAPRTTTFDTPGTHDYPVPSWANYVEGVYIPAGGGGHGGNGANTFAGVGGQAAAWFGETLVRGVDFPDLPNVTIRVTVPGPSGGGLNEQNGGDGGTLTRAAIPGGKAAVVLNGALGGRGYDNAASTGGDPGDFMYGGVPYQGGEPGIGGRPGSPGGAPGAGGGGGYGGIYTIAYAGGAGGRGQAWFRARQN